MKAKTKLGIFEAVYIVAFFALGCVIGTIPAIIIILPLALVIEYAYRQKPKGVN